MTALRQRTLDAMILRGYAARTQEAYIDAVARLARHLAGVNYLGRAAKVIVVNQPLQAQPRYA